MVTEVKTETQRQIIDHFDRVLGDHFERLTGSRTGFGGLPITSVTIAGLALLMERELEIEADATGTTSRYTAETLTDELIEMDLEIDRGQPDLFRKMIDTGHIACDDDNRFVPRKPATRMADLLDNIFTGMPGIHFVAYIVQTVNEVKSGRKTLASAVSQFDQTLHIQGVAPVQANRDNTTGNASTPAKPTSPTVRKRTQNGRTRSSRRPAGRIRKPSTSRNVLSAADYAEKLDIKPVTFGTLSASETEAVTAAMPPGHQDALPATAVDEPTDDHPLSEGSGPEDLTATEAGAAAMPVNEPAEDTETDSGEPVDVTATRRRDEHPAIDSPAAETPLPTPAQAAAAPVDAAVPATPDPGDARETNSAIRTGPYPTDETVSAPDTDDGTTREPAEIDAEDIEQRIADFERDLAMQCPVCKTSQVTTETTSLGKIFYKCSRRNCNFISWGMPYHRACPQCNNVFLIEATDRTGNRFLKCPRATCSYRVSFSEKTDGDSSAAVSDAMDAPKKKIYVRRKKARRKR